jgi:hypothetical protein
MAKQEVGLKIDVDVSSVGNMKQQLRAATNELVAMNEKFGSSSKEATEAARRVAKLKDAIGDAKALADTFNPDKKFVALGGAVQGAVAGFSALQGAVGLFGDKSKEVEEVLLKVQSAMALQQGISGVAGAMDSMKLLAGTIKTQVVTAFSTLRGAIIATGIGALGIAVALVAANFDEFKKKIFALIPGLETAANFIGGLVTKFTDFVGITSEAERNLDKFTKTNKRANESIDAQIKLLEAQGGKEDQVYKLKKQRTENELNDLREAGKAKGKLTEEEQKQIRDLKIEQQILDIEEANRKKKLAEDAAKEQKDAADKLQKQKDEEEKLRKAKAQKLAEDRANEERQINEDIQKIVEEQTEKEIKDREQIQKELDEADERERQRLQNRIELQKQYKDAVIQAERELNEAKWDAAQQGLEILSTVFAGNKRVTNALFLLEKGLAIGKIVIDTQKEIAGYYANPTWKLLPDGGLTLATAASAKAKIRAALGIASIAATSIAKFSNGGGGGSLGGGGGGGGVGNLSAPVTPALAPQVVATQVNTAAVNQMGNRAARAYVLNSDIQNDNQRNAYIDRNASIG